MKTRSLKELFGIMLENKKLFTSGPKGIWPPREAWMKDQIRKLSK
jgi:hypothetical protein